MAEENQDGQEKTEEPTQQRLQKLLRMASYLHPRK